MNGNANRTVVAFTAACMTFAASLAATINWKADDSGIWSGEDEWDEIAKRARMRARSER